MDFAELKAHTPVSLRNAVEKLPRKVLQGLAKEYGIKVHWTLLLLDRCSLWTVGLGKSVPGLCRLTPSRAI
jgi:hypothetical protein